jgi:hypothetical protein
LADGRRSLSGVSALPNERYKAHIARNTRIPGETTIEDRDIVIGRQPRAVRGARCRQARDVTTTRARARGWLALLFN